MTIKAKFVDESKITQPFPPVTTKVPTKSNSFGLTEEIKKVQAEPSPRTT